MPLDRAFIWHQETRDTSQQRCLSCTRGPDNGDDFSAANLQIHIIERACGRGATAEPHVIDLAQRADAEHERRFHGELLPVING
jgi:hypothetical protein